MDVFEICTFKFKVAVLRNRKFSIQLFTISYVGLLLFVFYFYEKFMLCLFCVEQETFNIVAVVDKHFSQKSRGIYFYLKTLCVHIKRQLIFESSIFT